MTHVSHESKEKRRSSGGGLSASHETAVFDPAEGGFATLWLSTEGPGESGIALSNLPSEVQSWKLLTAVVTRKSYGKCRMKEALGDKGKEYE
jgi:hypothetical protein